MTDVTSSTVVRSESGNARGGREQGLAMQGSAKVLQVLNMNF
jgi:hypothetical protein